MGIFSPLGLSTQSASEPSSTDNVADQTGTESLQANGATTTDPLEGASADATGTEALTAETGNEGQTDVAATEALGEATTGTYTTANSVANTTIVNNVVTTPSMSVGNKAFGILASGLLTNQVQLRSDDLKLSVREAQMVHNFAKVASEHRLSAPLVAAFNAVPGFQEAVANFPEASLFDAVAEPASSPNNVSGLESLSAAEDIANTVMQTKAAALVAAFGDMFESLAIVIPTMQAQVAADVAAMEASDLSDDVLFTLPVMATDDAVLNLNMSQTHDYIEAVEPFATEALIANPELVVDQIKGMQSLVQTSGNALGLSFDAQGLTNTVRGDEYQPTQGSFGEKNITVASIPLLLSRADSTLTALDALYARKDEILSSLEQSINETPQVFDGNDAAYGASDHVTLLNCYTTFATSLVNNAVQQVAQVLSITNSALDVEVVL